MFIYYIFLEYILIAKNYFLTLFLRIPNSYKEGDKDLIVIPGFTESWVFLKSLSDNLNLLGFQIHTQIGYSSLGTIESNIEKIENYILRNNLKNVVVLSHSKGSIVGNALLGKDSLVDRISTLITISCPYKGTIFSNLRIFNLIQLNKKNVSKFIEPNPKAKVLNFYPKFDNHILPNSSLIDGRKSTENLKTNVVGHTRILEKTDEFNFLKIL